MEASGDEGGEAAELPEGPLTSTPKESSPSSELPSEPPRRTDSSTSFSSESSGEEWLIKVCCPGARHRYRRYARNKKRMPSHQEEVLPESVDVEDALTKAREWMPITSYKVRSGVSKKESLDLQWLIKLRCPRALMEEMTPEAKESLPAASTSLSKSPSKTRSSQSEKSIYSDNWLTQKRFSIAQGVASLDNYNPSSYDPFFLKTPDVSKVSVPPLRDPLLKEIQDRYLEAGIIQQCETGRILSAKEMNQLHKTELPLLPMSRQLMSPIAWLKLPARFVDSDIRLRSQQKMVGIRNQCSMDFRSWGDPSWGSATKRRISVRKPDCGHAPTPMTKQILLGSSGQKPPIKSAS